MSPAPTHHPARFPWKRKFTLVAAVVLFALALPAVAAANVEDPRAPGAGQISEAAPVELESIPAKGFDLDTTQWQPAGIWSDGTTMWVADGLEGEVLAYRLSDGARDASKDPTLDGSNTSPVGIWTNREFMWVVDLADKKVYVYRLSTKARVEEKEFDLDANKEWSEINDSHDMAMGAWSDGRTLWIIDSEDVKLYAYNLADGARQNDKEFALDPANSRARDIWSDGTTVWASDVYDGKLYAYSLEDGTRQASKDIELPSDNHRASGIWSDLTTMWVAQVGYRFWSTGVVGDKLFAYDVSNLTTEPAVSYVIYHDPNYGAAAVSRYNQAVALLQAAGTPYTEVTANGRARPGRLAGVTNSVMPRFFLGDPTSAGWTSEPGVNNGGLRWLREQLPSNSPTSEPAQPAALTGLTVSPVSGKSTELTVSWTAVAEADRYLVRWRINSGFFTSGERTAETSYTIGELRAETAYTVRVTALDTDTDPETELAVGEAGGTTNADPDVAERKFYVYHDPDTTDARSLQRLQDARTLLTGLGAVFVETSDTSTLDRLAGVSEAVMPRFFYGDPTDSDWLAQPGLNNGGLRWLRGKLAEQSED